MLMQWTIILIILIVYRFIHVASLFEGCESVVNLDPSSKHTFQSPNYTYYDVKKKYAAGSSCLVHYIAPQGYTVRIEGFISLDVQIRIPNCFGQGQKFLVSRNGDKSFSDADVFCGSRAIYLNSVGSQMTVGYVSDSNGQGRFQIFASAVRIDDDNCNCGWGLFYKFNKIETQGTYKGYTSTVGVFHIEEDEIVCTGVIISSKYILSSAHCYYNSTVNTASTLEILAGYRLYPTEADSINFATYQIESIKVHEEYSSTNPAQLNDVALIKTKASIRFTRSVSPVCLPMANSFTDEDFYIRKTYDFVGWSSYNHDGLQQFLRHTKAVYLSLSLCDKIFSTFIIKSSQLCVRRYNETIKYPEYPGAALFYSSSDRKYLIGLYNSLIKPANNPSMIFTRIANYTSWIESNIGDEFLCKRYF